MIVFVYVARCNALKRLEIRSELVHVTVVCAQLSALIFEVLYNVSTKDISTYFFQGTFLGSLGNYWSRKAVFFVRRVHNQDQDINSIEIEKQKITGDETEWTVF